MELFGLKEMAKKSSLTRKSPKAKRVSTVKTPTKPISADQLTDGYKELLERLKSRIGTAQIKAAVAVNRELIELYWEIGREIVGRQEREKWGNAVLKRLANDLQAAFPGIQGFSERNVWRMRSLYLAYTKEVTILPQPVAELDGVNMPQPVAEILCSVNQDRYCISLPKRRAAMIPPNAAKARIKKFAAAKSTS